MTKLNVNLGDRGYPIYIANDYMNFGKCLQATKPTQKILLVTDSNVDQFQARNFTNALQEAGYEAQKCVIPAGEQSKNLDQVREIYHILLENKFDRSSTLIALGGGVVGDLTGFVAATYLRGIRFVQVPTSLLAQADSSVGGKVGVDFEGSKNMVGAFYQPKLVYINVNSLKTLPKNQFIAGLAEVIKHGIIGDSEFFDYIDFNIKKISSFDVDALQYLAKVNCSIKGSIVEQDEKENEIRANLNFGHTIGHAIESVTNFSMLHGECVSLGMVAAFKIAKHLEMVDSEMVKKVEKLLMKVGLPVRLPGIDVEAVYNQMFHDKKIKNNRLLFILPRHIGEVVQINLDDSEVIKKAIAGLGED